MTADHVSPSTPQIPNLSRRLSRSLALQTMLGLGLVCVAVYWGSWLALAQRQQESLEQKQVTVTHLLQQARANRSASSMQHMLSDFLTGHEDMSIRVSYASGALLFEKLHQPLDDVHSARRSFSVVLPAHVDQQEQQLVQVLLMLDRRPDDALLRQLAWILGLAAVSGALLVSLFSAWLVRRGLAPLHSLVEQTRQLGAKDLTHDWQTRLDDSNQPQELRPLIAQFNALLERLAVAYRQMEAFNADVAHELNTPLTTLISSCELALRKPRDAGELRDILASNLESAAHGRHRGGHAFSLSRRSRRARTAFRWPAWPASRTKWWSTTRPRCRRPICRCGCRAMHRPRSMRDCCAGRCPICWAMPPAMPRREAA
jgi:two-component system heavy metal sensor histidine kinase CusS